MKHKRGTLCTSPQEVIDAIMEGRQLFNDCTIPTNGKWRSHSIGYIIDRVKEGKVFTVKGEETTAPTVPLKDKISAFLQRDAARINVLEDAWIKEQHEHQLLQEKHEEATDEIAEMKERIHNIGLERYQDLNLIDKMKYEWDCKSGNEVCSLERSDGYPCYRHLHETGRINHDRAEEIIKARENQIDRLHSRVSELSLQYDELLALYAAEVEARRVSQPTPRAIALQEELDALWDGKPWEL